MGRLAVAVGVLFGLVAPASAVALPYLSIGNARHHLERRFEHEEERGGSAVDELLNCHRVSSTHVNCYSAVHFSSADCEVFLRRVWESATQSERRRGEYTLSTKGSYWEECQSEAEEEEA